MGRRFERWFIPIILGFAPVVLLLLTWVPDRQWTLWQAAIRSNSMVFIGAETFVILVAFRSGLLRSFRELHWPMIATIAAVLLLLIAIGTSVVAPNPGTARTLTVYWIIHALFGFALLHLYGRAFAPSDLIWSYLAGFAAFTALFILFVFRVPDPASFDWTHDLPAVTHIRHFGYYAAAVAGLCAGLMAMESRRGPWAMAFLMSALALGVALWTGSRGAIFGAAGGLAIGLVLIPAVRSPRCWLGVIASALLAGAIVFVLPTPAENMGVSRTIEATSGSNVATGRTEMWRIVFEAIKQRPVFGHGEGQMHTVAPYSVMIQPHDSILQVLLAWGVAGALCLFVLAFIFARSFLPTVRSQGGTLVPPFMAMASLAAFSLIDGALFYALPISIFAACAAMIAYGARRGHEPPAQAATAD
jgi:O-antigen ligase